MAVSFQRGAKADDGLVWHTVTTPNLDARLIEVSAFLDSDEAAGQWRLGDKQSEVDAALAWVLAFSDAPTAFAFKIRFG
jgi:hypothetical protein